MCENERVILCVCVCEREREREREREMEALGTSPNSIKDEPRWFD
jgi:hypothetical protein